MKTKTEILEEAFTELSKFNRRTGAISVGVGKTHLGLMVAEKELKSNLYSKFLVVIPKLVLKGVWKEEAIKHGKEDVFKHISFTTYRSLSKLNLNDYSLIIFDEVHNLLYSHDKVLSEYKYKTLGLTGTPPKIAKSEKGIMVGSYCPVKYTYILDDAIEDCILNDYKIFVHSLELNAKEATIEKVAKTGKKFYVTELSTYKYWNNQLEQSIVFGDFKGIQRARIMRMKALQDTRTKENYARILVTKIKEKCLIFANTKEQAHRISSISYYSGNSKSEENLQKFKSGKEMVLSCVLQLNEGVNIPNLKNIIVLHSYSNERKLLQRIGRAVRLDPNEVAIIHILMYKDTVDVEWVASALSDLDSNKITYL